MVKFFGVLLLWATVGGWGVAALVLVVVIVALDGLWLRALPRPLAHWRGRQRESALRTRLEINPHDRSARFDLAERLVRTGRGAEALPLVEANLAAGDDDVEHLLLAGMAAATGTPEAFDRAHEHFAAAIERNAGFRSGAPWLELGRAAWACGRHEQAIAALDEALQCRPGSVEIRTMLADSLRASGRAAEGDQRRAEAIARFTEAPKFERRMQRSWAWRADPMLRWRYLAAVGGSAIALALVTGFVLTTIEHGGDPTLYDE